MVSHFQSVKNFSRFWIVTGLEVALAAVINFYNGGWIMAIVMQKLGKGRDLAKKGVFRANLTQSQPDFIEF